ncbi:hypothetical protein FEF26_10105 [Nesterenkonia salmonea]|uniref:Uncharacterized protein n=1 Tax=Nesterenkonia salmonea TaxID=1804987 RepID=A0A5R9B9N9_9MICC|nr:hypothetical protein [Nesterenkonia salmonea]TLP95859.1 hypothetical protein FEF26_10105 [Nesterenkonia salmonea]
MFSRSRSKRAVKKVKPGDGHTLKPFKVWQLLSRSLFFLPLRNQDGTKQFYAVSVDYFDWDGRADLYLNGRHEATSELPAAFPVPGGLVEVATSTVGLKRMHYVTETGLQQQLLPDQASAEGLRARLDANHPTLSRGIGAVSLVIMLIALLLGAPQVLELVTSIDVVADVAGTFTSPVELPAEANTVLSIAAVAAGIERALRLRHHWLLDGDFPVVND